MPIEYQKAKPITLAEAGYDEKWLQELIRDEPSILGLGDLNVIQRERRQSSGGRIDFLMSEPETDTMYEIEIMLGRVDESHIIRTIEYWDIERRRWPGKEHRAVIVAEEITNRFFNVIALLNRSVPIIAIQLSPLQVDNKLVLNFVKVLDIYESPEEEEEPSDPTTREDWESRSNPQSLGIVDAFIGLLAADGKKPRITYNKGHIAVGTSRLNFCWLRPRKAHSYCHFHLRVGEVNVESVVARLEEIGINVARMRRNTIRVILSPQELQAHKSEIQKVLKLAKDGVGGDLE